MTHFLSLLPPTALMGMSLPFLVRGLVREGAPRTIGVLYAANTLGAAVGALLTPWLLLRFLGVTGAILAGACGSAIAGLGALILAWWTVPSARDAVDAGTRAMEEADRGGEPSHPFGHWVALYALSGFVSLSLEMVWFRVLDITAKGAAFTFGTLLAVYLVGLAGGTFAASGRATTIRRPLAVTALVAPRFASNQGDCHDALAPDEVGWRCAGPESWRSGGTAVSDDRITSFDLADEILRKLARKETFPNLKTIVVAGHSAGGQYAGRYAMANQVHDRLGVAVTYVVGNPSSYTYLDARRPTASALPSSVAAAPPGYQPPPAPSPPPAFAPFPDARNCTTYDNWPYGLGNRLGYGAKLSDDQLKKQLASRPAIYLLGELDILPLYGFDSSCPAMAQGPTRLARGLAYGKYVNESHGAQHQAVVVAACGHSARCMFTAEPVLPLLFPRGAVPPTASATAPGNLSR